MTSAVEMTGQYEDFCHGLQRRRLKNLTKHFEFAHTTVVADPGIFDWGEPNFGSERTVKLFCGKLLLPYTSHTPSHRSRLHVTIPWPLTVYFASRGEQIIGGYPKSITFLNIPGIYFRGKMQRTFH